MAAAWVPELVRRSREVADGSVKGVEGCSISSQSTPRGSTVDRRRIYWQNLSLSLIPMPNAATIIELPDDLQAFDSPATLADARLSP